MGMIDDGGIHDDIVDATRYSMDKIYPVSKWKRIRGYAYLVGYFLGMVPWLALYARGVWNGLDDLSEPGTLLPFVALLTLFATLVVGVGGMLSGQRIGVTASKVFLVLNMLLMLFGLGVFVSIGGQLLIFIASLFLYAAVQSLASWLYLKYSGTVARIYGV